MFVQEKNLHIIFIWN